MKWDIDFDEDNYVKSVSSNIDGEYEFDFETEYVDCYYLKDDEIILDKEKLKKKIEDEELVGKYTTIKQHLIDSDSIILSAFEEVLGLSNPITFISDFIRIITKYSKDYKETLNNRIKWRKELEDIKKKMEV